MNDTTLDQLPPLKVKCTQSDCKNGLHCYLATQKMRRQNDEGRCRSCGIELVAWRRVHERNRLDAEATFRYMRTEFIRHHFWHVEIDEGALAHARGKGMIAIRGSVGTRLSQSIGRAKPFWDGMQTPFQGRVVYYAQHATATCCRRCVEEWHGIPRGRPLTENELGYLEYLVTRYLDERVTDIPEVSQPQPRRKKTKSSHTGKGP